MNEPIKERYELWDEFLDRFPLEKINSMRLEEYSQVGSKECFTWWVESGLDTLGSIWGSPAFKFGIYARRNAEKEYKNKRYSGNDQYAWLAKYGETQDDAFSAVKSLITKVTDRTEAHVFGSEDIIFYTSGVSPFCWPPYPQNTASNFNDFSNWMLGWAF